MNIKSRLDALEKTIGISDNRTPREMTEQELWAIVRADGDIRHVSEVPDAEVEARCLDVINLRVAP
jgi:hypothetical protein